MEENKKLVVAALVILLGSNASGFINAVNPNARKDPFTGTEGRRLQSDMDEFKRWREKHETWGEKLGRENSNKMAGLAADVRANSYLIKQCMRATGTGQ